MNQFLATAICGNDITSSCLYVSGLCAATGGQMAPICLMMVSLILWCFRSVYSEAVTALPVNGGAYNILLNTTTKQMAALAACLTLLSYIATGVVSGADAMLYLHTLWGDMNVELATIIVLVLFALLTLWGIGESAVVALVIFVAHLITLVVLIVCCIVKAAHMGGGVWVDNWQQPFPDITFDTTTIAKGSAASALFYGTSAALLGISGYESSANYVEDQAPGVFVKTLRNMWIAVSFFNPLLSFLSLALMPLADIQKHSTNLLAEMAFIAGGQWLKTWVVVDAVVVLSGAVLTAYVGVTGLVRRMAMDRCLPEFLLHTNSWRGTNHWIIIGFCGIASSLFLMLNGDVETLSGVYNLAFLSVMLLFALGTILLKWKRPHLPRDVHASPVMLAIGMTLVSAGLVGNILRNPTVPQYFMLYFGCTVLVVAVMFQRTFMLRVILAATRNILSCVLGCHNSCMASLEDTIQDINRSKIVFFAKDADLVTMNKAILYVRQNEQTSRLLIVHCYTSERSPPDALRGHVMLLDALYPKLRVDLVLVRGDFGPPAINAVCSQYGVPANMMFISCPDAEFPFKLNALGGVRIITTGARSLTDAATEYKLGSAAGENSKERRGSAAGSPRKAGQDRRITAVLTPPYGPTPPTEDDIDPSLSSDFPDAKSGSLQMTSRGPAGTASDGEVLQLPASLTEDGEGIAGTMEHLVLEDGGHRVSAFHSAAFGPNATSRAGQAIDAAVSEVTGADRV